MAGNQSAALIIDGEINYMVLNTKLNIITMEMMYKMSEIIDTVEK